MSTLGMRGADLRSFMMVARQYQVILLVRHTNENSLHYIGQAGYYPKPAAVKAKTADVDPTTSTVLSKGVKRRRQYKVAGLVIHPDFHPSAYLGDKAAKAKACWEHTMETLSPGMLGKSAKPESPDSLGQWGVERHGVNAPRWSWRVDIDPDSERFGCIQLKSAEAGWSYIHGDYDLKDVIVLGDEAHNERTVGTLDGVKNCVPLLKGLEFETIQREINKLIGTEMVQHGAEAQFAWHGDEGITIAYPDWRHLILHDALTVQAWYRDLGRKVLAQTGKDYLGDRQRMYHFGPEGMYAPGKLPKGVTL